ncbi:hypothetical protein KBC80_02650 [Candidatus Woesebacteria bacterium]|jgi:methionyl-tRNA synthetase|nr:hypothetical protein [Candidatus Woesebacteria bacterium]
MHLPWYLGNSRGFDFLPMGILFLFMWSAVWTGLALWHAARRGNSGWFIWFLLVHTAGIVEIIYLFTVVKIQDNRVTKPTHHRKK